MFSKEDYGKYFNQLASIERKMIYGTHELAAEADAAIREILKKIENDKIKRYGQILKMPKLAGLGQFEGRREVREDFLGIVRLRDVQNPGSPEVKAYCVNLSKSGICLESSEDFSISPVWDLEIQLLDAKEIMTHRGRLVWSRKIEPDYLMGGIDFLF